jgi:hypothetical protein
LVQDFKWPSNDTRAGPVSEVNLQSFFEELGENSYMKEVVALRVMQEAGVPAPSSFHLVLNRNGAFYGLYGFVEDVDEQFLEVGGGRGC